MIFFLYSDLILLIQPVRGAFDAAVRKTFLFSLFRQRHICRIRDFDFCSKYSLTASMFPLPLRRPAKRELALLFLLLFCKVHSCLHIEWVVKIVVFWITMSAHFKWHWAMYDCNAPITLSRNVQKVHCQNLSCLLSVLTAAATASNTQVNAYGTHHGLFYMCLFLVKTCQMCFQVPCLGLFTWARKAQSLATIHQASLLLARLDGWPQVETQLDSGPETEIGVS